MPEPLPPQYQPSDHEGPIYQAWERAGVFLPPPRTEGEKTFSILMPPPNANGSLHVGHAVFVTLQDLMVRYHRMKGDATVWFPGLDHAGFETQVVFEKFLEKQGKSRFGMARDEFYDATMAFTKENSTTIINQFRRLGASADWSRLKFTLDPDVVDLVHQTFVTMYEDELAYRDVRPVNWCTKHQTTLSDLETKDELRTDPLYYLKYGPVIVATGRPETIFGDVAVAVHPDDERYSKLVGTEIEVDLGIEQRSIKVVADEMVDREFGTGVVKITPAHDPNDFEVAKRHKLPMDKVAIDERGKLTALTGPFEGLKVEEARGKVVELLQEKGLIDHVDDTYQHTVKVCYKCSRTIEPRILPQWYIAMNRLGTKSGKNLTQHALGAVNDGRTKFVTERFEKLYRHWLDNIRDWAVSRQIVWGIRLPVWYCRCGQTTVRVPTRTEIIFLRHGEGEHNVQGIGNGDPSKPYHLTDKGKQQIAEVVEQFKRDGTTFDAVYASQMPRVQETAKLVAESLDGTIITDKRLNDIVLGELEGQPIEVLHKQTDHHMKSVGGSETFQDVLARIESFVKDRAMDEVQPKRILIITSEISFWALRKVLNPDLEPTEMRTHVLNGETHSFSLGDLTPCSSCGHLVVERDPDVFDTWFSSGQWPVTVPKTTGHADDYERFYPTMVMETGWDILFFWVARMMVFGLYLTDEVPFKQLYFHGMVRDKDRQKMSKSKGNVMDPLAVIDQYGTDALRMALVFNTSAGNDMPIDEEKIRGMRNFSNKLWNISRFILMNAGGSVGTAIEPQTEADTLILTQLDQTIEGATHDIDTFRFHEAAQRLYAFVWDDLAATYIEASKAQLKDDGLAESTKAILIHVLAASLKLLHPIMPFVTETVWQQLPADTKDSPLLAQASWPQATHD
ncbi:MAG: class I tRNA ligase family protein [Patescibacteria group bacterium]